MMRNRYAILLGGVLVFLGMSVVQAATYTATMNPTNCVNNGAVGSQAWSNPDRAVSSNNSRATATVDDGQVTNYLICTGYGFTIPAGATISGITVNLERMSEHDTRTRDSAVYLVKAGTVVGSNRATTNPWATTEAVDAHGGGSDLWGVTWTPAEINASNFGVAVSATKPGATGSDYDVSVDLVQVVVTYTLPLDCSPPAGAPAGVTCVCDEFNRASLNPSTIFGGNWIVTTGDSTGVLPRIASTGYMRLTENTSNNAKAATVPAVFPALGNYISVEFRHYAYNGSGADGIAVTLSDYSVPATPGAYGGSLGYAQRTGIPGFAGGWIGVALDEFGNFSNPTEGRVGGPGFFADSVTLRGSGTQLAGAWTQDYRYLAHSVVGNIDNAGSATRAPGYLYQIIVDARSNTTGSGPTAVSINRDTGSGYSSLISLPNIYTTATGLGFTQAAVPTNWQISFTGSTGGSNNIHELTDLRICAATVVPTTGGAPASFNAIDEAYSRTTVNALQGRLYTKLAGTAFTVKVAALADNNSDGVADAIQTTYALSGNKTVRVELIDDSAGASCNTSAAACSACSKPVITSQNMTFTSGDTGFKQSANFTVNSAYSKVLVRMCEGGACPGTLTGCSVDTFAIRPTQMTVSTSNAGNTGLTGTPVFKAGTDQFSLSAQINAGGYTGSPKINTAAMAANGANWVVGAFTPAGFTGAVSGLLSSTATTQFTYGEAGNFRFLGYDPASNTASARGVYDDLWTVVDSAGNDCVAGSYGNAKDANGKYGCNFGIVADSVVMGRFVPATFALLGSNVTPFCSSGSRPFVYQGQAALGLSYRLEARNGAGARVTNYSQINRTPPYPVTTPTLVAEDQTVANQGCELSSRLSVSSLASWNAGLLLFNDANADDVPDSSTIAFSRPATPVNFAPATCAAAQTNGPGSFLLLDIGVKVADPDGVPMSGANMNAASSGVCAGAACDAIRLGSGTALAALFGRVSMNNASGSELLQLPLRTVAEYYSGSAWVQNADDNCTTLAAPTLGGYTRNLGAGETTASLWSPLKGGNAGLKLSAPGSGNNGSVTVTQTVPAWLRFDWDGNGAYDNDPSARATFGTVGVGNPRIFMRENY